MISRFLPPLFLVLALLTNWVRAEDVALIPNGNFETDVNADQWPDDWGRPKSGGNWGEESGNHFLRLTSSTPGEMVMLYQQVRIPAAA